jgi:two-component system phosphate regulon sensor histidine kinase PhoR
MFRRLLVVYALLLLAVGAAVALAIVAVVENPLARQRLLGAVGGIVLAAWVAGGALSAWLARRITRPLKDLVDAVEQMGAGTESPHVFPTDADEISLLGETFNRMSEQLGQRIAALELDRNQLRAILSGMVEGVVALDAGQRVLFVNDRARELLELGGVSPVGRPVWEVVRQRPLLDAVRRAQESGGPWREEFTWSGATPRNLTVHAARLPGDPPRGAVLVLHDTSELRRLERLRQEFVANVSHELKTPLSVITTHVETLLDGALDDPQHRVHFIEQIGRQSDRLHALILDLLSLARIESGSQVFDFQPVELDVVLRACAERHVPRAQARQQTLGIDPGGPPVVVWADEDAVDQVLENLLDNALKYTPPGGAVRLSWGINDGEAWFEVADTGIGIPQADLPRIFERFYRVDKARSRELGGTGLGLSIVKHLSQAMHGSVRAASEPGKGAVFTVCLPLART